MAAASSMEYASRSVVADGASGLATVSINSVSSGFAAGGEQDRVKHFVRFRRKAVLLIVNEAAEGLVNWFAHVKGGDENDGRNTKYVSENLDLKIVDINKTALDF